MVDIINSEMKRTRMATGQSYTLKKKHEVWNFLKQAGIFMLFKSSIIYNQNFKY